MKACIHKK